MDDVDQPTSAAARSPFPPIADYAFLSDCHTGALVAPDGSIDWLCAPRFDSPSVFGSLLDREAGSFRFAPFGLQVPVSRHYEPGTNTVVTTWNTPTGWAVVRDALVLGPRRHDDEVTPHTRPPTDEDAEHLLVRTVRCIDGRVEIELVCEPVFDYGRAPADWELADEERHTVDATGAGLTLRLRTDLVAGIEGSRVRARHVLEQGEACFCALSWSEGLAVPDDHDDAVRRLEATTQFWRRWLAGTRFPDHPWRQAIQRSALTIKGLTYMPTGATVAALTTSLPETPGGERNWDYRYTWMRDTSFTLRTLHLLGLDWEAEEFIQFVADLEPNEDGGLQIMYGIDGRRDLTEEIHPELSGYGGRAARAHRQRRLPATPERRLRRGPRRHPPAHPPQRAPPTPPVADRALAGRARDGGVARARPGDLGGPRRAAALRVVQAHVLGRARSRVAARRDPRRPHARRDLAADRRGDPRGHPRARRQRAAGPAPALRHGGARRVEPAGSDLRLPARRGSRSCARASWRSPTS